MKVKVKRLLSCILAIALIIGIVQPATVSASPIVEADTTKEGYEIYPNPHQIDYLTGEFVIRKDVNVVYDSTIDAVTKKRMTEVLESKDKKITISEEVVSGKTNILVGTYLSNEYASNYIQEKNQVDVSLFEKNDSYFMSAKDGEISILGKNTDAAFYGITSLKHIFNQMDGSTI